MRYGMIILLCWSQWLLAAGLSDPLLQRTGSWGQSYADQWGLFNVNAILRSDTGALSPVIANADLQPVVVAIIDTGIDYRHPDLPVESLWRNTVEVVDGRDNDGNGFVDDLIGWDFVDDRHTPWDDHGHGTHVAGIIAAQRDNGRGIAGVAPNVRLMALKALNSRGYGRGSDIARAIRYAVDHGARIIHLSLGGQVPGVLERQALDYAEANQVLVVAAAGNRAEHIGEHGYELFRNTLVVGAIGVAGQRAAFSDWGARLDLVAPGVDILSLRALGADFLQHSGEAGYQPGDAVVGRDYYRATGNSFAAPFVTGAAALLLGLQPELTPFQLRRILRQSARLPGKMAVSSDLAYGAGVLDIAAALEYPASFFISSRFMGAEFKPENGLVLYGQADADQFVEARLEIAKGLKPSVWQPLKVQVLRQRREGPLAVVPLSLLPERGWMTLRLRVVHGNGDARESYLQLQRVEALQASEPMPSSLDESAARGGL